MSAASRSPIVLVGGFVAALLLSACGGDPVAGSASPSSTSAKPSTTTSSSTSTPVRGGAARSVVYTATGTVPRVTFVDTLGEEKTEDLGPAAFQKVSVLPAGTQARIEAKGGSSTTGVSCTIRVDGKQVNKASSDNAETGVVCSVTVP
jgi:hypothetical protein